MDYFKTLKDGHELQKESLEVDYSRIFPENRRILLVGVYPPPLGGVSVHLYRLVKLMESKGYEVDCFDISKPVNFKGQMYLRFFKKIVSGKFNLIHFHVNDRMLLQLCFFMKKFHPDMEIFFSSHNDRFLDCDSIKEVTFRKKLLGRMDALIVVGQHILDEYQSNNVALPERVFVKNAFLEPPLEEEKRIVDTYPESLITFLHSHKPLISANAFKIAFYKNEDLYGLDLCIELTGRLQAKYENVGFVFALANASANASYIAEMKRKIKALGIEHNFYFLSGQKELWPLLKKVDLVVRPTNTDGDTISIREALYFDKPVIASDVVDRPKGVTIFKNRELNDLTGKCRQVLGEFCG